MSRPEQTNLVVQKVPIKQLRTDALNARKHTPRQIAQVERSIKTFGFIVPVLGDRNNNVIAGHCRIAAAMRAGLSEVPVIRLEHLSESQVQAFRIADNRLAELATWDDQVLGEVLADLASLDLDFELEDIGFTTAEIDLRIEAASERPPLNDADEGPPVPNGPQVSRPGDMWQLDAHRLYCGDALEGDAYRILMQGKKARMVFADTPYNVPIEGHVCGKGAIHHREFAMASGEMTDAEYSRFLTLSLSLLAQHSTPGSLHFICMDWRHIRQLLEAGQRTYAQLTNLCVWVKSNAGMGSFYRSAHELIGVFKKGRRPHRNNVELGRYGRNRSNVWCYPGANSFGRAREEGNLLSMHPTTKPVAMIADAILDCTARRDLVLDPFLGSGSTLLAAQRVGRICYAMEIDPTYVDTAIRRWQQFSGGNAIHADSGQPFSSFEQRREGRDD